MELEGTTQVNSLPSSTLNQPEQPAQIENIKISNPLQQQISSRENDINTTKNSNLENTEYNELISSLQVASQNGQTKLPDRNISQETTHILTDETIKPNYIPESKNNDYIDNDISPEEIIDYNNNIEKTDSNLDKIYNELKYPILIGILYFLFQLPIIQKYLYKIIPSLFKADGNPNIFGYLLNSTLFAVIYYFLIKSFNYFSKL